MCLEAQGLIAPQRRNAASTQRACFLREGLGHVAVSNVSNKCNGGRSAIDLPEHDVERADDRRDIGQHMPAAQKIHRLQMGERRRPGLYASPALGSGGSQGLPLGPRRRSRHRTRATRDQCLNPSVMTTSVASGSCTSRLDRLSSLQLARFTTLADWAAAPAASTDSTMLSPWRSRKNVCSPNKSLSCGIRGWSSGMVRASNWPKVRSTCAELSFIAHSFRFAPSDAPRITRCGASHLRWSNAKLGLPPPR